MHRQQIKWLTKDCFRTVIDQKLVITVDERNINNNNNA